MTDEEYLAERPFAIWSRQLRMVNTDPQRRCNYGVNAREELQWTPWELLHHVKEDEVEDKLKFWRELNDYAVSQRGKGAHTEYEVRAREEKAVA